MWWAGIVWSTGEVRAGTDARGGGAGGQPAVYLAEGPGAGRGGPEPPLQSATLLQVGHTAAHQSLQLQHYNISI